MKWPRKQGSGKNEEEGKNNSPAPYLEVKNLSFSHGDFNLDQVNLSCSRGEYHVLLGPTGSGKSTLAKCLLGLNPPQQGSLSLEGEDITRLLPEHRGMGYLPQHQSLFPHLDVLANIRFGLNRTRTPGPNEDNLIQRLCSLLGIRDLLQRRIKNLSGGESQKVALARALASEPRVMVLDEPFSSLDPAQRRFLWFETKQVITELGITTLHITHDLDEAYILGDRLSVMISGRLIQSGSRTDIFQRPKTREVASFLGYKNIFSGTAIPNQAKSILDLGDFKLAVEPDLESGKNYSVCIRPQDIKVIREDAPIREDLKDNVFSGIIVAIFPLPEQCLLKFRLEDPQKDTELDLRFPIYIKQRLNLQVGDSIRVGIWKPNIIVFR